MIEINSKNTKAEIIAGAEEYITHLEDTLYNPQQVVILSLVALVIGFLSGLHY